MDVVEERRLLIQEDLDHEPPFLHTLVNLIAFLSSFSEFPLHGLQFILDSSVVVGL